MRRFALALLASTSLLGLASVAEAADLAIRKAPPPPPPPLVWSWTGFYLGAHVGAGWSRKEFHTPDPFCRELPISPPEPPEAPEAAVAEVVDGFIASSCENSARGSHNAIGGLGGAQVGFNWQTGSVVFGIEAQYSWANLKGDHADSFHTALVDPLDDQNLLQANETSRFFSDIKGIGTIAGRIGLVSGPEDRTLFYVKGGGAYVKEDFREAITGASLQCFPGAGGEENGSFCESFGYSADASTSRHRWGWMIGAGIEFGLWDNWSAKVEYNYLDFGDDKVKLTGTECFTNVFGEQGCNPIDREHKVNQNIQLIKFGLNYRFGRFGKAPAITARY
jgi:outer membrane immunogenic protein